MNEIKLQQKITNEYQTKYPQAKPKTNRTNDEKQNQKELANFLNERSRKRLEQFMTKDREVNNKFRNASLPKSDFINADIMKGIREIDQPNMGGNIQNMLFGNW